jgi:hypothetical protein
MASASVNALRKKLRSVWPLLDERARRLMAASEALAMAYGGVSAVHRACGLSRKAIAKGIREIRSKTRLEPGRIDSFLRNFFVFREDVARDQAAVAKRLG